MENRKQAILRAVVHEFTTNAVPVGSQALQSRYFVNLSSATIRSELAELADLGYLAQPHTSAGRVPTDSGYRYFVDFLMDLEPIPDRVQTYIRDELKAAPGDVEGMVERVAMTVAAVTQNASVASAPQGTLARIKHLDLVSLEPKEVLLILLLEGNLLRQQVVNTSEPATQADLTRLTAQFNASLSGRASDEARRHYDGAPLGLEKELLGRVIAVLDMYEKGTENLVVHDGVRNLLRQPEFAESSRVHQVLEVLEETRYLTVLLRQLIGESDLQIVIGSENTSSQLQGCAVVLTTYGPSDRLKGVLGVIGPTRMAYSQTVARLQAVCVVAICAPRHPRATTARGPRAVCARSGARPRLDIPRLEKSSGNLHKSRPCDVLAVGLAFDEAAVQDAHQTIGQSAQSLMVGLAAGAQDVVSMPCAFGASERGERPLIAGVGEPAVPGNPGEYDLASARGPRDRRGTRIALASLRMQKSGPVVTELGHSPGAEDNTESRQTEVDLGVRVRLKTRSQLLLEGCNLQVELFDDSHGGGDAVTIGFGE